MNDIKFAPRVYRVNTAYSCLNFCKRTFLEEIVHAICIRVQCFISYNLFVDVRELACFYAIYHLKNRLKKIQLNDLSNIKRD